MMDHDKYFMENWLDVRSERKLKRKECGMRVYFEYLSHIPVCDLFNFICIHLYFNDDSVLET